MGRLVRANGPSSCRAHVRSADGAVAPAAVTLKPSAERSFSLFVLSFTHTLPLVLDGRDRPSGAPVHRRRQRSLQNGRISTIARETRE